MRAVGDSRLSTLASVVMRYSLDVRAGDIVMVQGPAAAAPFWTALASELADLGAHPMFRPELEGVDALVLERGSQEQITAITELERIESEVPNKVLTVWYETNTRRLSAVAPARLAAARAARADLWRRFFERVAAGEARWCGVTLPSQASAQEAAMSLEEYQQFVYGAGHLEDADPISRWRQVSAEQAEVIEKLSPVRELRIVAEETDLTVDVGASTWLNADGHENFPDGEVYTSPDAGATRGHISFSFDSTYHGNDVAGVRLWFEDGRVVREEASRGARFLTGMLDMDEGARRLGEVAFGLNDEIQRATRNTAFDEKIGGTCHVALGMAFPEAGGSNHSGLHWDLVCDLRQGGEVYGDGELIARNGRFL
jgi:aminopeptidase